MDKKIEKRVEKLLLNLAQAVDWTEGEAWDDPEDLIEVAGPAVFEARKILKKLGIKWEEDD